MYWAVIKYILSLMDRHVEMVHIASTSKSATWVCPLHYGLVPTDQPSESPHWLPRLSEHPFALKFDSHMHTHGNNCICGPGNNGM